MIDQKELDEFLKASERPPTAKIEDVGKEAVIVDLRIVETPAFGDSSKTYKKLLVTLEINGVRKVIFLSRGLVLDLMTSMGENINDWIGKKVVLTSIKMNVRGKIVDKVIFEPLPEQKEEVIQ